VAVATLLVSTACSSSGGDKGGANSSGSSSTGPTSNSTPIKIGFVSEESGPIAGPATIQPLAGAQAAVAYLNKEVNGFGGRQIQIVRCDSQSTAAGALTCANKMVSAKVDLVMGASAFWGSNGLPVVSKAHIMNQTIPFQPAEVRDPYAFPITGGIFSEYPAQSYYAVNQLHASNGVAIIADNGSSNVAIGLYKAPWTAAGKQFDSVVVSPATVDLSTTVAKALSYHPDAIVVSVYASQAIQLYENLAQQGFDMTHVINQGPTADFANFFPKVKPSSILEGTVYSSEFSSYDVTSDPEVALYRHAMETYQHTDGRSDFYVFGFSGVMTDYLVAKKIGFDKFDGARLKESLMTTPAPVFMGYEFDLSQAPKDIPQAGSSYFRYLGYQNGKLVNLSTTFLNSFTGKNVKRNASPFAYLPGA
jgi:branched-chain amino acid transport system substrate-binding protein